MCKLKIVIFLFQTQAKKKENHKSQKDRVLYIGNSFTSYFAKAFPEAVKLPKENNFFKTEYTMTFNLNNKRLDCRFVINEVSSKYYLDTIVFGSNKANVIKGLEYIHEIINKSDIHKDYIQIISYDSISEYYCNKIYPKLNELERNLRKLLFNIYVVHFGQDYYKITIDNELQNKVKRVIQAKGNDDNKEIERLKKFFYSMEFYDIQQMLFKPHWTELDEKARNNFLEKHEDLSNLSDHELREIISNIGPKSDWERFFSDKTDKAEFESFLDVIRESRNKVAHCKFFYKLDYFDCNKTIRKFNKVIKDAIYLTEDKEFIKKNSESIKEALSGVMKGLEEYKRFMENISKSISRNFMEFTKKLETIGTAMEKKLPSFQSYLSENLSKPKLKKFKSNITFDNTNVDNNNVKNNIMDDEDL